MSKKFTLGKTERIKSRKLIEQIFDTGKSFNITPYRTYYLLNKSPEPPADGSPVLQFGVGVSTKNFRRAVDRNRVKRVMREAYRLQKSMLYEKLKINNCKLSLFVIYTGKELPEYKLAYSKMTVVLQKLMDQLERNSKP